MSNVTPSTSAVKSPYQLAREMGAQGYSIRFFGDGEAVILNPHNVRYFVSLTGETWAIGCSCPGGRTYGRCKHLAVFSAFRPCDHPA